ncbi:site-2 protease family protein [Patescibacteria group bacterium]|nr:site-2 protease family protein [Patescibacteria group bacterium]
MFIVLALLALSVLVFFHELGHFLMAKIFKVKVEEFGIGYPPRLGGFVFDNSKIKFFRGQRKKKFSSSRTIYSLNLIPLGGFTKLKGEMGGDESPDSFATQVWWKKALVAGGGALMNVFLAILLLSFLGLVGIPRDLSQEDLNTVQVISEPKIQIGAVFADSPAAQAGLEIGDVLLAIDGQEFSQLDKVQSYIQEKVGQSINLKYQREEKIFQQSLLVSTYDEAFQGQESTQPPNDADKGFIGVFLSQTALVRYPWYQALGQGVSMTFSLLGQIFSGIFLLLKSLLTKQEMMGGVVGPVGITRMISDTARLGFIYLIHFAAILSVAIGAFQLIPFPALDGSRIVFSLVEGVRSRRFRPQTEAMIMGLGFYLLLALLVIVSFREIVNLF